MNFKILKEKIFNFNNLTVDETSFIFDLIMTGKISEIEISAILIALKLKSETKEEILGASLCMREKSIKIIKICQFQTIIVKEGCGYLQV